LKVARIQRKDRFGIRLAGASDDHSVMDNAASKVSGSGVSNNLQFLASLQAEELRLRCNALDHG
jgi:hypothetical protein